jgi:hypothetical protein
MGRPPPRRAVVWGGGAVATGQLFIWSSARGEWTGCQPDEITWLDRRLLSGNADLTLHRAPRCAGIRYVHRRWELFSRDATYRVYVAPHPGGSVPGPEEVQRSARHVLPAAPAHYEALPVVLEEGSWLVSVGAWVLPLRLDGTPAPRNGPVTAPGDEQPRTRDSTVLRKAAPARRGGPAGDDAVAHVRGYFERNATARLAMAYYYQEYILGLPAPHPVQMMDVVIALDLTGEGAVSDYKKLLQGFIWKERGHARDLADFLLSHALLTPADLDQARQVAADNERSGVCERARQRLRYRPKGS